MSSFGLRAARAGALEVIGGRPARTNWGVGAPGAGTSPSPPQASGRALAREGPARAGEVHAGTGLPTASHSAHSSLSSSCNFSSALRFNLSQPDPAAALTDAGAVPVLAPHPQLFVGAPAHPARGGAPGRRGLCCCVQRFLSKGEGRWHLYQGGRSQPETWGG